MKLKEMSDAVMATKEKYFIGLKKSRNEFESKYGDDAESVMHATAMNMAKKKHGMDEETDPLKMKAEALCKREAVVESRDEKMTITVVQQALADMDVDSYVKTGTLYVRGTKEDGDRARRMVAQAGLKMPVRLVEETDMGQFHKKLGESAAVRGMTKKSLVESMKTSDEEGKKSAVAAYDKKKATLIKQGEEKLTPEQMKVKSAEEEKKKPGDTVINPVIGESIMSKVLRKFRS